MLNSSDASGTPAVGSGPRIQIFGRDPIFQSTYGTGAVMLDVTYHLRRAGCLIELVILTPTLHSAIPWHIIPARVDRAAHVVVRGHRRIGRVLIRGGTWSEWLLAPGRIVYHGSPSWLKGMLRSFLARLRQSSSQASAQPNYDVPATPGEVAFAWAQVQRFNPDVVIANRTWLANLLDPLQAPTLKVIYTHDVIHQRMTSFDEHNLDSGLVGWDKQKESAFLRKAHVLLAIQEEDAETLREMAPSCEVMCTPMSASVHEPTAPQVPARCLFVGADATQNIHGLEWFLEEVWPLVLAAKPECSLHVCGSVESRFRGRRFPRVRFLGIVDDLSKEYSEAQVCLVPLLVGSGLKVKLVEALSYGRACVSTSVGMQGLRKLSGEAVLVADSPQTFARGVDAVLSDDEKRYQMEQKAMAYVVRHLSPTAVYGEFVNRIQQHVAAMT